MLATRLIRRSAPTPATFEEPRGFTRSGVLERADGPRTYRACVAVWGTADSWGDTFVKGSIDRTIPAKGIPVLVSHRRGDDPVGKVTGISEDDYGCYVDIEFAETARGAEIEQLVAGGFYRAVSFGGVGTAGYEREDGVWAYTEARMEEVSITAFPADEGAVFDIVREAVARRAEEGAEPTDAVDAPATAGTPRTSAGAAERSADETAAEADDTPATAEDPYDLDAVDQILNDLADLFGVERTALNDALSTLTRTATDAPAEDAPTVPLAEELELLALLG